jgi:hypothetical protein
MFFYAEEGAVSPGLLNLVRNYNVPLFLKKKQEWSKLKVHKHEIFFLTFFAETETIWSQGPVTRDF